MARAPLQGDRILARIPGWPPLPGEILTVAMTYDDEAQEWTGLYEVRHDDPQVPDVFYPMKNVEHESKGS